MKTRHSKYSFAFTQKLELRTLTIKTYPQNAAYITSNVVLYCVKRRLHKRSSGLGE